MVGGKIVSSVVGCVVGRRIVGTAVGVIGACGTVVGAGGADASGPVV